MSGVACAQPNPESQGRTWDLSVWAAAATGEEHSNSFSEAQIFSAGVFVGHPLTGEIGRGWRRGSFEFGADFVPVFMQLAPQKITGTAFDPVIVRWNSHLHRARVTPFVEVGGGGLHTRVNSPKAILPVSISLPAVAAEFSSPRAVRRRWKSPAAGGMSRTRTWAPRTPNSMEFKSASAGTGSSSALPSANPAE